MGHENVCACLNFLIRMRASFLSCLHYFAVSGKLKVIFVYSNEKRTSTFFCQTSEIIFVDNFNDSSDETTINQSLIFAEKFAFLSKQLLNIYIPNNILLINLDLFNNVVFSEQTHQAQTNAGYKIMNQVNCDANDDYITIRNYSEKKNLKELTVITIFYTTWATLFSTMIFVLHTFVRRQ